MAASCRIGAADGLGAARDERTPNKDAMTAWLAHQGRREGAERRRSRRPVQDREGHVLEPGAERPRWPKLRGEGRGHRGGRITEHAAAPRAEDETAQPAGPEHREHLR